MTLLEMFKKCEGKFEGTEKLKKAKPTCTLQDLNEFKNLLSFNPIYLEGLKATEDAKEFYEAYEFIRELTPVDIREDVFYAAKVGFIISDVPSKLVYILRKALNKYKVPNMALESIDRRVLSNYLIPGLLPEGVTVKVLVEDLLGDRVSLLSEYNRMARYGDVVEVYVENTDRVLVGPAKLGDYLQTSKDLSSISYEKEVGVCLHSVPVRTLGGKLGVVLHEYDLRGGL